MPRKKKAQPTADTPETNDAAQIVDEQPEVIDLTEQTEPVDSEEPETGEAIDLTEQNVVEPRADELTGWTEPIKEEDVVKMDMGKEPPNVVSPDWLALIIDIEDKHSWALSGDGRMLVLSRTHLPRTTIERIVSDLEKSASNTTVLTCRGTASAHLDILQKNQGVS